MSIVMAAILIYNITYSTLKPTGSPLQNMIQNINGNAVIQTVTKDDFLCDVT